MIYEVKYIFYEDRGMLDHVVCFDAGINHADMANALNITKEQIHSAGFVSIGMDFQRNKPVATVYGESIGLKIKSDPNHSRAISRYLGIPLED